MQTIYTIYQTSAAIRSLHWLHETLFASLTPEERKNVKILTNIVTKHNGHLLAPGDTRSDRYIRVVIDIAKSRLQTPAAKQELLQRTVDACLTYEGKYAELCEVEVKINEVDESDYVRVRGRKAPVTV